MVSDQTGDLVWIDSVKKQLDRWLEDPESGEPTSQITGAGAVAVAERRFSRLHQDRPALMVSSGTAGMVSVLRSMGVRPGSQVLISGVDWPGTLGAIQALGAEPVIVPVDQGTVTMSAEQAADRVNDKTSAIVVCHPLGIPADVSAIRSAVGEVPIIEDCAQALGSTLDGCPVGCFGDFAVFSFGPGKPIDIGEGGMILASDWRRWESVVQQAGHPLRQLFGGIDRPSFVGASCRPHPLAAVLLATALHDWTPSSWRDRHQQAAAILQQDCPTLDLLGFDERGCDRMVERRRSASAFLPIRPQDGLDCRESGLYDINAIFQGKPDSSISVRLLPVASILARQPILTGELINP